MNETHPSIKKARKEKWPNNKPEYYGNFIENVMGDGVEVHEATNHIMISVPEGKSGGVNARVIDLHSEEKARAFLTALRAIDTEELSIIKGIEFSFDTAT